MRDASGDEDDGYDETLFPVDFAKSGQILDDDLYKHFVCKLPAGVTATCLMDCCHSGTVLDLPYVFVADGKNDEMAEVLGFNFDSIIGLVMGTLKKAGVNSLEDLLDKKKRHALKKNIKDFKKDFKKEFKNLVLK